MIDAQVNFEWESQERYEAGFEDGFRRGWDDCAQVKNSELAVLQDRIVELETKLAAWNKQLGGLAWLMGG